MNEPTSPDTPVTPAQGRCLSFIEGFIQLNGYSPSTREIADGLLYESCTSARELIDALQVKGKISKAPGIARSIQVLVDAEQASSVATYLTNNEISL